MSKDLRYLLLLSIIVCLSCKKSKNATPDYTSKMGGVRIWSGYDNGIIQPPPPIPGTTTSWNDTWTDTFALGIVDANTVKWDSQIVVYRYTDSSAGCYVFPCHIPSRGWGNVGGEIRYFYSSDRIVIGGYVGSVHGTEHYSLSTP